MGKNLDAFLKMSLGTMCLCMFIMGGTLYAEDYTATTILGLVALFNGVVAWGMITR